MLANFRIVCLSEAADSSIWIGLDGGVMRYDPGTDSYTDYAEQLQGIDLRKVRAICEDSAGDVWIGHENGVVVASPDGKGGYSFMAAGGLEAFDVSDITEDGRGNVWIGTSQGLYLCSRDGRKSRTVRLIGDRTDRAVRFVECDRWGVLWVSHDRGISVSTDGERFTDLRLPAGMRFRAVCTVRDRKDHLWVGCDTEGIYSLGLDAR